MTLDVPAVHKGVEAMASQLDLDPVQLAEGILAVANANMERAIRVISVEKGFDPREFTLFSFGGAGGMHCVDLARLLGMPRVFVPVNPGILSAVGMLLADVVKDYSHTVMQRIEDFAAATRQETYTALEQQAAAELEKEGVKPGTVIHERYLDMRYAGQSFEIIVPHSDDPAESFQALHEKQYGHRNPDKPVEVVNVRLRSRGRQDKPEFARSEQGERSPAPDALLSTQSAVFNGIPHKTQVIDRSRLKPGNRFTGPAVVTEYSSTIVVPPGTDIEVDEWSNMVLDLRG